MRKATLLVIKHIYRDEDAIQTVLRYAMDSRFAIFNKILASGVRTDCFDSIVEDFYNVQEPYKCLKHHRKLFHFVLTTTNHATRERTLDEGAYSLAALLESLGHQFVMVPHSASITNPEHYHWHVVINVKSYTTGVTMLDRYTTYGMILKHLNNNPYTKWTWMYRYDNEPNFLAMI